jgi:hypothetical protein
MLLCVFTWKLADVSEVLTASIIALMMEAVSTCEASVIFYETILRNIPEDSYLHTRRSEKIFRIIAFSLYLNVLYK